MKQSRKSRRQQRAAKGNAAENLETGVKQTPGDGAGKPAASQSWKEYMEQAMPVRAEPTKAQPQPKVEVTVEAQAQARSKVEVKVETQAQAQPAPANPGAGERAKVAWEQFCRWTQQAGTAARTRAVAALEQLDGLTAQGRKWAGQAAGKARGVVARHPVSPLLYATVLAVGICWVAFKDNYVRAYVMEVNGQEVGIVSDEDAGKAIVSKVESRAASVLGEDYNLEPQVTFTPAYAAPAAISDATTVEDALFNEVGAVMTAYAVSVDGVEIGVFDDADALHRLLDEIAQPFIPDDAIRYEFEEDVKVYPVEVPSNSTFDLEAVRAELSALKVERAVYTVKKGDTFNAIAYSLDMDPNELSVLNPDVIVDKLWVDQELVIQQAVPRLSVRAITDETYEQVIPSPVEYIETADLYVGETKVKEQGEDGLARINAHVTYINNVELDREVVESTTLKEATTTYTYTGTTPRPVTASNGYFIWPVRGTITSNFGGRNLWGSYDFHLGLDIAVPYGTGVKAADGGTVIKAGWSGSYGNLVAIRHDNGIVTYYAHNSSLLVGVGDKVYQGQIIARAGSTGNSSGNHCHFEVRVNGTSVNPRNYLS